jgi:poly-gamma-glutamate capsule biosynthesis protein CapA/YwtB (metallophosphatase superfamily)
LYELTFLGDLYPGEYYQQRAEKTGGQNVLASRGYRYSFERILALLEGQDAILANLETPLTDAAVSPFRGRKKFLHFGDIAETPRLLTDLGIHHVSLANNHVLDYGAAGLEQTLAVLDKRGIRAFGAGGSSSSAAAPIVFPVKTAGGECSIVVAAGFEYRPGYDRQYAYYSDDDRAGVNGWPAAGAAGQIRAIREQYRDGFIIAFPHWGDNYTWRTPQQKATAEAIIDAGADLIIGHGAHALQEIDQYAGKWIVYSLGNSVFNSPGRYGKMGSINASLVARLSLEWSPKMAKPEMSLKLYPILSDNLLTGYQPRPLLHDEASAIKGTLQWLNNTQANIEKALQLTKDSRGYCFQVHGKG